MQSSKQLHRFAALPVPAFSIRANVTPDGQLYVTGLLADSLPALLETDQVRSGASAKGAAGSLPSASRDAPRDLVLVRQ